MTQMISRLLLLCLVASLPAMSRSDLACARELDARPNLIVIYTDDHGYADLSCQNVLDDIKTPHVDALAKSGVLARHGYSTAPQCVPSRAGLLVGKFQSKFGVEANGHSLAGFDRELTIAERLRDAGYITAQFGKWHLGPGKEIPEHGFKHVFSQNAQRPFAANLNLDGSDRRMSNIPAEQYHIDGCSQASAALISRYKDQPFFLYVAYRAPHVPLDAPQKYLDRFPGTMPERRRQALAMLSAVDDGVGLLTSTLAKHGLSEKTLIFYIGDNGAPLKIFKRDAPGGGPGWDGSLNDPLNGEKGMLTEGGMHVPFVISWPGTIPAGQVYEHPITALDVAATSAELAQLEVESTEFDGVNLIPFLTGQKKTAPHDALMWRWLGQSAIREGNWKYLRGDDREYLFDLETDLEEAKNLASQQPEIAKRLRAKLSDWSRSLDPPGLSSRKMSESSNAYFDYYLDGKSAQSMRALFAPRSRSAGRATDPRKFIKGWSARNGKISRQDKFLILQSDDESASPFLVRNGLKIDGPMTAILQVKATQNGPASIAWRTSGQKDFKPDARAKFEIKAIDKWQSLSVDLPIEGKLIHLRMILPTGKTMLREFQLEPKKGDTLKLW